MSRLLILLLGLVPVQAIGYSGGKHPRYDECDGGKTKTPKPTTKASTTGTTTPGIVREPCPPGYTLYTRTPSPYNNNLSLWCMKVLTTNTAVSINNASLLCQAEGSVLTNYENEAERLAITAEAQAHIVGTLGHYAGSIAVSGNRVAACDTMNLTWQEYPPCNNRRTVYVLPASSHTNPDYSWETWSFREPNTQFWTREVETCLQLHVVPGDPDHHGLLNDMFCRFAVPPNNEPEKRFWNMGALCGVFPDYTAVG